MRRPALLGLGLAASAGIGCAALAVVGSSAGDGKVRWLSARAALASPRIALTVGGGYYKQIFVMNADGSGRSALTHVRGTLSSEPSWSPDATRIAFVRTRAPALEGRTEAPSEVYVMNADGSDQRPLTSGSDGVASPRWSPDGTRIVYARRVHGNQLPRAEIWVMNADGSNPHQLTSGSFDDGPSWSPDGSRIAFSRAGLYALPAIYTVPAGGGQPTKLIDNGYEAVWSPDGSRIAFVSVRDRNGETCYEECSPNGEVYLSNADGSNQRRLTYDPAQDDEPSWSPDGSRIAFVSDRSDVELKDFEIYSMSSAGGCPTRLTNSSVDNRSPAWEPRGSLGAGSAQACARGSYLTAGRRPTIDTDLSAARAEHKLALYWLGDSFHGLLVSDALRDKSTFTFSYSDCGKNPGRCGSEAQIQITSICARNPLTYIPTNVPGEEGSLFEPPTFVRRRGVVAAFHASAGGTDVYTGSVTVTIFSNMHAAQDLKVLAALRPFLPDASHRLVNLPRARFPITMLRKLDRLERLRRIFPGLRQLARKLHLSQDDVRTELALVRAIGHYSHDRASPC